MPFKPYAIYPTYEINVSFYSYFSWFFGVSHWLIEMIFVAVIDHPRPGSKAMAAPNSLWSPAWLRSRLPKIPPLQ